MPFHICQKPLAVTDGIVCEISPDNGARAGFVEIEATSSMTAAISNLVVSLVDTVKLETG